MRGGVRGGMRGSVRGRVKRERVRTAEREEDEWEMRGERSEVSAWRRAGENVTS